jgi:hypothetical protein
MAVRSVFRERLQLPMAEKRQDFKHHRPLQYDGTYLCPVCRHGQIQELALTEAFACDFCRHIFTANLTEQTLQVVDSSQPMTWRWNGRGWLAAYQEDYPLSSLIWLMGAILVVLPCAMIWGAAYVFPPLPDSQWASFPTVWATSALILHLGIVLWIFAEYYQMPFYVSTKIRFQRLLRALSDA